MTMEQLMLIADISLVRALNDLRMRDVDYDQGSAVGLVTFEHNGQDIWDPFVDESTRFVVDPIDYYGEDKLQAMKNSFYGAVG